MTKRRAEIIDFGQAREERRPDEAPEAMQRAVNEQLAEPADPSTVVYLAPHRQSKFVRSLSDKGRDFLRFLQDGNGLGLYFPEQPPQPKTTEENNNETDIRAS